MKRKKKFNRKKKKKKNNKYDIKRACFTFFRFCTTEWIFPIGLCDQNQLQNNYEDRIKMYVTRDVVPVDEKKTYSVDTYIHTHTFTHRRTLLTKMQSRTLNSCSTIVCTL